MFYCTETGIKSQVTDGKREPTDFKPISVQLDVAYRSKEGFNQKGNIRDKCRRGNCAIPSSAKQAKWSVVSHKDCSKGFRIQLFSQR